MIEKFVNGIVSIVNFLAPKKLKKITSTIKERTDFITIVIDDIDDIHFANTLIRSADAFGLVDVYVVEKENKLSFDRNISGGGEKWLNIKTFYDYESCFNELEENGYKICVICFDSKQSVFVDEFEIEDKIALVFGAEKKGVLDFFKKRADVFLNVKTFGFVEGLNPSVSAGIILFELRKKLKDSEIDYKLSPVLKSKMIYKYFKKS